MGITHTLFTIKKEPKQSEAREVVFLVDSGAEYSVVPSKVLRELGVESRRKITIVLADGTKRERSVGDLFFEYQGEIAPAPVIFGEEDDEPLLGLVTLEALGLLLDPLARTITKRQTIRM